MNNSPRTREGRSSDSPAPAHVESRGHRREHAQHVAEIVLDREERQQFARRHREIDNTLHVVRSLCFLAIVFGTWRLFAVAKLFIEQSGIEGGLSPLLIGLEFVVEAAIVVGLIGLERSRHRAPVRLALGLAVLRTSITLLAGYALFASTTVDSQPSIVMYVTAGGYVVLALLHWYAFVALRSHADEIVHLRHARHDETSA